MIAATLLLCVLLLGGGLSRPDGAVLACAAIAYTAFAYLGARACDIDAVSSEFGEANGAVRSAWTAPLFLVGDLGALVLGAELLVTGAAAAVALGIGEAVFALTVIAIGTSLPELATSVNAAHRHQPDVAFRNVIGSNMLNVLGVLGVASLIHPSAMQGLRTLDFAMLIGTAVLLLALMLRVWVLNRWKGLPLGLYAGYVFSLVQ